MPRIFVWVLVYLFITGCTLSRPVLVLQSGCQSAAPPPLPGAWPLTADGSVTGTVIDENDLPVAAAVIHLDPIDSATRRRITVTDSAGVFVFEGVEDGYFVASIGRVGVGSRRDSVRVEAGSPTPLQLRVVQQRLC
jgi:hypothetical protein